MKLIAPIVAFAMFASSAASACNAPPLDPAPCPLPGAGDSGFAFAAPVIAVGVFFAVQAARQAADVQKYGYITRCTASGVGCSSAEGQKPAIGYGYELGRGPK